MAPKKQPPKNAYFYYMLEFQRIEKAKGNDISIKDASEMASNSWKVRNRFFCFRFSCYFF